MRRYDGKTDEDLILDDKLDIARTILQLKKRQELRHEKNRVETIIKQSHRAEVNDGTVVTPALPDGDDLLKLFGLNAPEIAAGSDEEAGASTTKPK